MNSLLHDLTFAWRNTLKRPGTSLLIVLTLALGIGVNTAMLSMVWQVVLGPMPYANGEGLVQAVAIAGRSDKNWSIPTLEDVRAQATAFAGMASYSQLPYAIQGPRGPFQGMGAGVSWNFFDVFGVQPLLGRAFVRSDDVSGAVPVAVLSHEFWRSEYAGDPAAVGSSLEIMGVLYEVIGVLPELPPFPHANAVWIPETTDPYRAFAPNAESNREYGPLHQIFAVLRDASGLPVAGPELNAIAQRLATAWPDIYPADYRIVARPLRSVLVADANAALALFAGLSFLVLVIAAANIANLVLGRNLARSQELAIREALGASPAVIVRQLMIESMLFSVAGGMVALGVAYACLDLLAEFAAGYTPLASEIRMDGTVLLFSLASVAATGCFIGAVSALIDRDINKCLKEGGDKVTTSSLGVKKRRVLLVTQYMLAFVILTTSGLIVSSLHRLQQQDPGYDAASILVVNLPLSLKPPADWRVVVGGFSRQLLAAARAVPGVDSAAVFSGQPILQQVAYQSAMVPFAIEGQVFADGTPDVPAAARRAVSEGFFDTLGIPLLQGREITADDDEDAPRVAIVSASLAQRYFPGGDVLGQHIRTGSTWTTIVGVVGDIRSQGLDRTEQAAIYLSYWQSYNESLSLYLSSAGNPNDVVSAITAIVRDLYPRQPVERTVALDSLKTEWMAPARLRAIAITLFGGLALIVTLSGVIGVVSCNVSRRLREIGIHMATGASPGNILNLFLIDGLKVYLAGLLLGLALMLAGAPLIEPFLYETAAMDLGIYLASTLVLTLAVLIALYLPARQASRMSPTAALHFE
jgi:predicted permease